MVNLSHKYSLEDQVNAIDSDFGNGDRIAGWQELVENSDRLKSNSLHSHVSGLWL
ncbi:MAG: hypothetical protein ACRC80_35995 [Waterburya sp.]